MENGGNVSSALQLEAISKLREAGGLAGGTSAPTASMEAAGKSLCDLMRGPLQWPWAPCSGERIQLKILIISMTIELL